MKFFYYLKYFYFISRNWNLRLAFFSIYHELKGEIKYKIHTSKINDLKNEKVNSVNLPHASLYQGSNYYLLGKAFEYIKNEKANQNLVDFGSGKGRVLAVAAHFDFKKITGIEFVESLCNDSRKNLAKIRPLFPDTQFQIICEDVVDYKIENDSNLFFFFNPFDEIIMLQVVKNILNSFKQNSRKLFVIYFNPLHKEIFLSAGFLEAYYLKKMEYLDFSILTMEPEESW